MNSRYQLFKLVAALAFFLCAGLFAHGQKPRALVNNYTHEDYRATPLIWDMAQDGEGVMYFANNDGVLTFDGSNWELIKTPNPVRALAVDAKNRVYVGCMNDVGLLKIDGKGHLEYLSFAKLFGKRGEVSESFDGGVYAAPDGRVYYVGATRIFQFTPDAGESGELKPIRTRNVAGSGMANDEVYVNIDGSGLHVLRGGALQPVPGGEAFDRTMVSLIASTPDGNLLVATAVGKLKAQAGAAFVDWPRNQAAYAVDESEIDVYKGRQLANGQIALGSYDKGVWIVSPNGVVVKKLNTRNGYPSNAIYSVFEDKAGSLWIAHDAGLTQVVKNAPVESYAHVPRINGKIAVMKTFQDQLYVGTNAGAYALTDNAGAFAFREIENFFTETWDFLPFQGMMLAASTSGLRILRNGKAVSPYANMDPPPLGFDRPMLTLHAHDDSVVFAGFDLGVLRLSFQNGTLVSVKNVPDLTEEVSWIVPASDRKLWLGTKFQGLLKLDPRTLLVQRFGVKHGLPEGRVRPVFLGKEMVFHTAEGFYKQTGGKFVPHEELNNILPSGNWDFALDRLSHTWAWKENKLVRLTGRPGNYQIDSSAAANLADVQFAYVLPDGDKLWFCSGSHVFKQERLETDMKDARPTALIRSVTVAGDSVLFGGTALAEDGAFSHEPLTLKATSLPFSLNSITINVGASNYFNANALEYQYFVEGLTPEWSAWTKQSEFAFNNLQEGDYVFKFRARNAMGMVSDVVSMSLPVKAPWFRTIWAYAGYAVGVVLLFLLINRLNAQRLNRRRKELEAQVTERTKELNQQKQELEKNQQELETAYSSLKDSQNQLVQAEKMASLGQLIAGIAHEINTPIGAISASSYNMSEVLPTIIQEYPNYFNSLSKDEKALFFKFIERTLNPDHLTMTSREERQLRKKMAGELEEAGLENPKPIAAEIVKLGVTENIVEFAPLLKRDDAEALVRMVSTVGAMKLNLNNINLAVSKTSKIVYALKSYSHRQHTEDPVEMNVAEGLDTVLTIYHNQIKNNFEIVRNIDKDIPNTYGFPDELNQVWTNILHNAMQAMGESGTIQIDVEKKPEFLEVRITDSGPGIPPEIQKKIFEPFFTTKRQGEGTGMGLDLCTKIVRKHQGEITADSEPGRTTFYVRLPYEMKPAEQETEKQVAETAN